jgi:energy-coupling factor transporter ATPase
VRSDFGGSGKKDMSEQENELIRFDGVWFSYRPDARARVFALQDVNLQIDQGEYIAVVGANGSGKSTLLRQINALLTPTEGDVYVKSWNTKSKDHLLDIRSTVGMVFQEPETQIIATVVEEDVAFGPENLGIPDTELRERVKWALERTGLTEMRKRPTSLLSSGQKQLLAVASTLAMMPKCLLLDEATSMLDPASRRRFIQTIETLKAQGMTIIFATHSMEEAACADRVLVLSDGAVHLDGDTEWVFAQEGRLRKIKLDLPMARRLAKNIHAFSHSFPENVLTPETLVETLDSHLGGKKRQADTHRKGTEPKKREKNTDMTILEAKNLSHWYLSGTALEVKSLHDVSLRVCADETVGIIGPAGSGKSTLLLHLNGLLRPAQGEVFFNGVSLKSGSVNISEVRSKIGLLFQNPEKQLFEQFAGDDVAFGPRNINLGKEEVRERVRNAMEMVGLPFFFKDRKTSELSLGEKRRLALAGILAMEPRVLVLDEPTASLDPDGRRQLIRILARWNTGGRAIVIASHSMEDITELADRTYVINGGKLIAEGHTRDVFGNYTLLVTHGLCLPVAADVLHQLSVRGYAVKEGLLSVEEVTDEIRRLVNGETNRI